MRLISAISSFMLFISLTAGVSYAQTSRIIKIIDTNLFELEDGRMIRMAGIEMPVKDTPGKNMQKIVRNILDFERTAFLKHNLIIVPADTCRTDSDACFCYIIKQYDLEALDYNMKFLEFGYGRLSDNIDSVHKAVYKKAEDRAIKSRNGMWNSRSAEVKDTLDRKYSLSETAHFATLDSIYQIELLRKTVKPIACDITLQTVTGTLSGAGGAMLLGVAAGAFFMSNRNNYDALAAALAGGIIGYSAGVSIGVYGIAKTGNPALNYLPVLGISTASSLAAFGIVYAAGGGAAWFAPLILPIAASVVYVNAIAPNPVRNYDRAETGIMQSGSDTVYKNHYNRNIQFRFDIINIPL